MIDFLKKQPLVGLALAIAAGYVLAHFAVKLVDYFFESELDSNPVAALILFASIVVVSLLTYRYGKRFLSFLKTHRRTLFWIAGALLLIYSVLVVANFRTARKLETAHQAYGDEYKRRCAQFINEHAGATAEEFHRYELNPHGLYGYANILEHMRDNHELRDPVAYAKLLKLQRMLGIHPAVTQGNDQDTAAKPSPEYFGIQGNPVVATPSRAQIDELMKQLASVTQIDLETVRMNFDVIRKRAQEAQSSDSSLSCQLGDSSFTVLKYEDAYAKRLGDVRNPSPALERDLYDEIVLKKQPH